MADGDINEQLEVNGRRVDVAERPNLSTLRPTHEDAHFIAPAPVLAAEHAEDFLRSRFDEAQRATQDYESQGSTGTVALISNNVLSVANVGDSPVVLFVRNTATGEVTARQITNDHNTYNDGEVERVRADGGEVRPSRPGGTPRIVDSSRGEPMLAVTRVFGDNNFPGVSREPEFHQIDLAQHFDVGEEVYVSVGCDGLYEGGATPDEYARLLTRELNADPNRNMAEIMAEFALVRSGDNISSLLTQVERDQAPIAIGVFDGHGGSDVSRSASTTIRNGIEWEIQPAAAVDEPAVDEAPVPDVSVDGGQVIIDGDEWLAAQGGIDDAFFRIRDQLMDVDGFRNRAYASEDRVRDGDFSIRIRNAGGDAVIVDFHGPNAERRAQAFAENLDPQAARDVVPIAPSEPEVPELNELEPLEDVAVVDEPGYPALQGAEVGVGALSVNVRGAEPERGNPGLVFIIRPQGNIEGAAEEIDRLLAGLRERGSFGENLQVGFSPIGHVESHNISLVSADDERSLELSIAGARTIVDELERVGVDVTNARRNINTIEDPYAVLQTASATVEISHNMVRSNMYNVIVDVGEDGDFMGAVYALEREGAIPHGNDEGSLLCGINRRDDGRWHCEFENRQGAERFLRALVEHGLNAQVDRLLQDADGAVTLAGDDPELPGFEEDELRRRPFSELTAERILEMVLEPLDERSQRDLLRTMSESSEGLHFSGLGWPPGNLVFDPVVNSSQNLYGSRYIEDSSGDERYAHLDGLRNITGYEGIEGFDHRDEHGRGRVAPILHCDPEIEGSLGGLFDQLPELARQRLEQIEAGLGQFVPEEGAAFREADEPAAVPEVLRNAVILAPYRDSNVDDGRSFFVPIDVETENMEDVRAHATALLGSDVSFTVYRDRENERRFHVAFDSTRHGDRFIEELERIGGRHHQPAPEPEPGPVDFEQEPDLLDDLLDEEAPRPDSETARRILRRDGRQSGEFERRRREQRERPWRGVENLIGGAWGMRVNDESTMVSVFDNEIFTRHEANVVGRMIRDQLGRYGMEEGRDFEVNLGINRTTGINSVRVSFFGDEAVQRAAQFEGRLNNGTFASNLIAGGYAEAEEERLGNARVERDRLRSHRPPGESYTAEEAKEISGSTARRIKVAYSRAGAVRSKDGSMMDRLMDKMIVGEIDMKTDRVLRSLISSVGLVAAGIVTTTAVTGWIGTPLLIYGGAKAAFGLGKYGLESLNEMLYERSREDRHNPVR